LEAHCVESGSGIRYICADINDPLPFESGSFDCVVSREGIEHLVTPFTFLGELCRVLQPGGVLFLTTPNIMTVDARMKYLLSGYFQGFRELRDNHPGLRELEFQGHISPIYFWQLAYFLGNYGFTIERVTTNQVKHEKKPFKRLLARAIAGLIRANARRRGFPDGGTLSDEFLFGDSLIVQARRTGERVMRHGRIF
jgi:SAM-dependent methyltransferase